MSWASRTVLDAMSRQTGKELTQADVSALGKRLNATTWSGGASPK
jgi:hypothetical protein